MVVVVVGGGYLISVYCKHHLVFSVDSNRLTQAVGRVPAACCAFPNWHGALGEKDGY